MTIVGKPTAAEQATMDALRDAAVRVAHLPGHPTSVTYAFAREVWGVWWELKRAAETRKP